MYFFLNIGFDLLIIIKCNLSFQGIGGFMVRQRSRPGQGPGKAKRSLSRKDSTGSVSENTFGKDEGVYTRHIYSHLY